MKKSGPSISLSKELLVFQYQAIRFTKTVFPNRSPHTGIGKESPIILKVKWHHQIVTSRKKKC